MTSNVEELLGEDHDALDNLLKAVFAILAQPELIELLRRLDLFWARLAMHIRAENLQLFPALLNIKIDDIQNEEWTTTGVSKALDQLRNDHDFFMKQLPRAIKILRGLSSTNVDDIENHVEIVREIVTAVHDRLAVHNELEEEMVYRLPALVLTSAEQSQLAVRIKRELENLPPRFH